MDKKSFFTRNLLAWFATNHRPLPWKGERDPYKIWLSEVILQQTRVEQGMPYFLRFVERYPTVQALADAGEDEVFKLWEGLGYYTRARNLHATAKMIAGERAGRFPETYDEIRALRGVGDYTAAAIASFAFGLPHAVVDGNVYRVLARYFGIDQPTDAAPVKKMFAALAQELLDRERPADFNQAIMDFGATHCTPQLPKCPTCPLQAACTAFAENRVHELPVRAKAPAKRTRNFLYAVFNVSGDVLVRKRLQRDIWQDLYEFPMLEVASWPTSDRLAAELLTSRFFPGGPPAGVQLSHVSRPFRQVLSHQTVQALFIEFEVKEGPKTPFFAPELPSDLLRVSRYDVKKNMAFPRIIDHFLQEKALTLRLI